MRALIVDDDKTSCQLLAKILKEKGIEAEWITDSLAGYNLSLHCSYDLFILDVRMPFFSGTEFAERLKTDNSNARIILISAFADEALQQTAHGWGVPLLSKPFSPARLLEVVAGVLGQ